MSDANSGGAPSATTCRAHDGIGEVREVIREQPIAAALMVFALGYLFGRLGALIPSGSLRRARVP